MCLRVNIGTDHPFEPAMRFAATRSCFALVLLFVRSDAAQAQGISVDTLRWMTGCWTSVRGAVVTDEMWMAPRGGVMLGVARTVSGTRLRDVEFTRVFANADTLVYAALPSNQRPTQFAAKRVAAGEVIFENLAHDYPKRIVYRAVPPDSLHAYIEGASDGERRVWYRYARAACT
jgi:hypothetical protein